MDSPLEFARSVLSYGWEHYWPRVLLLILMAALITFIAGAIARLSGAFSLDRDDVRREKKPKSLLESRSDGSEISPLTSQEPEESRP